MYNQSSLRPSKRKQSIHKIAHNTMNYLQRQVNRSRKKATQMEKSACVWGGGGGEGGSTFNNLCLNTFGFCKPSKLKHLNKISCFQTCFGVLKFLFESSLLQPLIWNILVM